MMNHVQKADPTLEISKLLLCAASGFLIGLASGLLGVGGGEFRIPILLYLLNLPVLLSIVTNLLIGLLVVLISFITRYQMGLMTTDAFSIALFMSLGSILGGYFGAHLTGRVNENLLKKFLMILLILAGFRMILDPLIGWVSPSILLPYPIEIILSALTGLLIGIVSGLLGVAGGEYRIPTLIYLFNLPIKTAGTVSLLVSIPTISTGLVKHWHIGHLNKYGIAIGLIMGFTSIMGSYMGALFIRFISESLLKLLLGIILLLATVRMVTKP
ncbi:MAG: sulfite exporter TauE/SafE family protein [Thermoproteota archaeon]